MCGTGEGIVKEGHFEEVIPELRPKRWLATEGEGKSDRWKE